MDENTRHRYLTLFTFAQIACFYGLKTFVMRVTLRDVIFHDEGSFYPPYHFEYFEDMWNKMNLWERRDNFLALIMCYKQLIKLFVRDVRDASVQILFLKRTFKLLLRFAKDFPPEMVSILNSVCKAALNVDTRVFIRIVSREDLAAVLQCFPTYTFSGWGIQYRHALMKDLSMTWYKLPSTPLVLYGFEYGFDFMHYRTILQYINTYKPRIKGKDLSRSLRRNIVMFMSLRLQQAMEILLAIFDPEMGSKYVEILQLIWRAVPYSYISRHEMFTLLRPFFIESPRLSLKDVCDEYSRCNCIFKVPEVKEPRTLLHLSRIRILRCMRDANSVGEEEINRFHIPETLKPYLRLECSED